MSKTSRTAKIFFGAGFVCSVISLVAFFLFGKPVGTLEALLVIIVTFVVFVGIFMTNYMYLKLFRWIWRDKKR